MDTQAEMQTTQNCFVNSQEDFTGISWQQAKEWTKNFRRKYGHSQLFEGKINGYGLSEANFLRLVNQDGQKLEGIKIYLGVDEKECFRVIVVGVSDANGNDYNVPPKGTDLASVEPNNLPLLGEVRPCPEWCGSENVLNAG